MNWYEKFENSACLPHDRIDEGGNPRDTPNQTTVNSFRRMLVAIIVTICASIGLVYYSNVELMLKGILFFSVLTAVNGLMSWGSTIDWHNDDDIRYMDKVGAANAVRTIILIPPFVICLILI